MREKERERERKREKEREREREKERKREKERERETKKMIRCFGFDQELSLFLQNGVRLEENRLRI